MNLKDFRDDFQLLETFDQNMTIHKDCLKIKYQCKLQLTQLPTKHINNVSSLESVSFWTTEHLLKCWKFKVQSVLLKHQVKQTPMQNIKWIYLWYIHKIQVTIQTVNLIVNRAVIYRGQGWHLPPNIFFSYMEVRA